MQSGQWSLRLLKNDSLVGGYVDSDFEDLLLAGNNWLASKASESQYDVR